MSVALTAPETHQALRLEYGKPCRSSRGEVVDGSECGLLASSHDVPEEVRRLCRPWHIGLGPSEAAGRAVAAHGHGTVFRAIRSRTGLVRVAARLERLSEGGQGRPGRLYWRARYLVTDRTGLDPAGLVAATHGLPLAPLLARGSAHCPPVDITLTAARVPNHLRDVFVDTCLQYLLSGVPVVAEGKLEEATFFALVSCIFQRLPTGLAKRFGAGWAIDGSGASALHVAHLGAGEAPGDVARFEVCNATWHEPKRIARGDDSPPFGASHLVPGRSWLRFDGGPGGMAPTPAAEAPHGDVRFDDEAERTLWRQPGLRALDEARRDATVAWLGGAAWEPHLCTVAPQHYFHSETAEDVVRAAIAAGGEADRRPRGDRVITEAVGGSRGAVTRALVTGADVPGAARSRLLLAVLTGASRPLGRLVDAARVGEATAFPEAPATALHRALDAVLDRAERGNFDAHLLELAEMHCSQAAVWDWLALRADRCAVAVAWSRPDRLSSWGERTRDSAPSPILDLLLGLESDDPPPEDATSALHRSSKGARDRFGALVRRHWNHHPVGSASRRMTLLPWLRLVGPAAVPGAAEALAFGLDPADADALCRCIEHGGLPIQLHVKAASFVLRQWRDCAAAARAAGGSWPTVLQYVPWRVALALDLGLPGATHPSRGMSRVADNLDIGRAEATSLTARWASTDDDERSRVAAHWLWQACGRVREPLAGVGLPGLCRALQAGRLPAGPAPEVPVLRRAARLARRAGATEALRERAEELWSGAQEGWQHLLLLQLFPTVRFGASPRVLSTLLPLREALGRHLTADGSEDRRSDFGVVCAGVFTLPFRGPAAPPWRKGFARTPLWAAFSGVPLVLQGKLGSALDAYAGDDTSGRIRMGLAWQDDQRLLHPEEAGAALERLTRTLLVPLAVRGKVSEAGFRALMVAGGARLASRWFRSVPEVTVPSVPGPAALPLRHRGQTVFVNPVAWPLVALVARSGVAHEALEMYSEAWRLASR